ncbi:innexin [Schistosoma bovis]|uniref:Innexin n=1 Tax=Schistosoma bovis TaxID=6184 RepID=A0A430Q682_SCHBO|nr:innexin [Schistosoma bovis]
MSSNQLPVHYTLQCVLPINNFTEKIYVFLWFWFAILGLLTTLNTLQWALNTILPSRRVRYIKQYLKALRLISSTEEQKIYVFLWFWFAILGLLTTLNTLQWALNTILPSRRVRYIKQYLKALRLISSTEERDCARFVNNNLGADGVFILHVVSKIASDLIALDVTATLWKNYRQAKITGTEEDVNRLLETVNRGSSVV